MITLDRPDLTAADLDGAEWLAVTGEPCPCEGDPRHQCCGKTPDIVLPGDVLAVLEPCETCPGFGLLPRNQYRLNPAPCPNCIDGRPKFQIVVPCPTCHGSRVADMNHTGTAITPCRGCQDGTASRTFTVTGDEPLLPVVGSDKLEWSGDHRIPERCVVRYPSGRTFLWPEATQITVVSLDEHTTHVLRIKAVAS